jgi:hypothetical protein
VQRWPVRENLMRLELARSESECASRPGGSDNVERCKELVRISHHGEESVLLLEDALVVFGPAAVGLWIAYGVRRGGHREHPPSRMHHHHDRLA